ncbi:MAG: hypothetical protein IJT49_07205 [Clostridia bacterium]|nr:hypothetical protein [Clostridia bacterium]
MNNNENSKKNGSPDSSKKSVMIAAVAVVVIAIVAVILVLVVPKLKSNNSTSTDTDNTSTSESGGTSSREGIQIFAGLDGVESVVAGETATVKIKVQNVTDLASLALTARWDEELTLIDASYGPEFSGGLRHTPDMDNENSGWDSVKSPFTFNWVALNTADAVDKDCVFVTAQFKTPEDKPGTYHMTLTANPDNIFDSDDENVPFIIFNADIVVTAAK